MYTNFLFIIKKKGDEEMKKIILKIIDLIILALTFLFILSSFFKIVSYTRVDDYIYLNSEILFIVWGAGIIISLVITPHLYQWILHFRK